MRFPVRLLSALFVIIVLGGMLFIIGMTSEKQPPPVEETEESLVPAGYDAYNSAGDAAFAKDFALQVSAFGDDPVTGGRSAGSMAERKAAALIEQTMKDIGLQNVHADKAAVDGWTFRGADVIYTRANGGLDTATLGGYQTNIIADGESVGIVDVGKGIAADYEGKDVADKLVLLDVDPENDRWINYSAYQAYVKGARAVLAVTHMAEDIGDRLVSQDIRGPSFAPVLSISIDDAKAIRASIEKNGELTVTFTADSTVTEDAETINVWGEIPGNSEEVIYFIAHYDGYYHAFYDDAMGVGLIMSMAQAFIESGYKPEKTLRFVTHGAEEWGKKDSEADWAAGAYQQIVNIHPEWAEKAFALINVDGGYPLADTTEFSVSVPYELRPFIARTIKNFSGQSDIAFSEYGGLPSTDREDFVYNAMGVPTIANNGGEGNTHYLASMFHSNKDVFEYGNYSEEAAIAICRFYGYTAMTLDQLPFMPVDFSVRFDAMNKLADENRSKFVQMDPHLIANTTRAKEAADRLTAYITEQNDAYKAAIHTGDEAAVQEIRETSEQINPDIHTIYRDIQDALLRLDWKFTYEFAGTGVRYNIDHLNAAIKYLKDGDVESAVYKELAEVDIAEYAIVFDKETCDYFYNNFLGSLEGTWAEGRTVGTLCYADPIVRSLVKKSEEKPQGNQDYTKEIKELERLLKVQQDTIAEILTESSEVLARVTDDIYALLDVYDVQE